MELGIVHLSDLHFRANTDYHNKLGKLINLTSAKLSQADAIYIIVSGDIAFSGKKDEYEHATKFFNLFKQILSKERKEKSIRIISIPGNHDCDFNQNNSARDILISQPSYDRIGQDLSVINQSIRVQDNYWEFHEGIVGTPKNKIHFVYNETIGDYNIKIECLNTAWMSQIQEKPGELFFPIKKTEELVKGHLEEEDINLRIGLYHHPVNWFTPNTLENNKSELERYLRSRMDIQLLGHEHESKFDFTKEIVNNEESYVFSGFAFHQESPKEKTGFQTFKINLDTLNTEIEKFEWVDDKFLLKEECHVVLKAGQHKEFCLNEKFESRLNSINIPLSDSNKINNLTDIYIFPDLDIIDSTGDEIGEYIDSKSLIDNKEESSIIEGDTQSGKSALLKILYNASYRNNFFPILISGSDISKNKFDSIIKGGFNQNYNTQKNTFEEYLQLPKDNRILYIDDAHLCKLEPKSFTSFLEYASNTFGSVVATVDTAHSLIPSLNSEFLDFKSYSIKPFGYQKKNSLIKRYLVATNGHGYKSEQLFEEAKELFNQVIQVLGDKIIPSYPVFILSILQTLKYKPLDLKETSYGYCYQSLIHFALTGKAKIANNEIDSYMNFLQELAYDLYAKNKDFASEDYLRAFYENYAKNYYINDYKEIKKKLTISQILIEDEGEFRFGYNYIFFFLVAKHISDCLHTEQGKLELSKLFESISKERSANILVFITHHTKDIDFIESSLLSILLPFDDKKPITLEKSGDFYHYIKEISKDITDNVIKLNNTPEEERETALKRIDEEYNQSNKEFENENYEESEHITQFLQAFRALEVVGQIVKNRKGSLPKDKLEELVTEIYSLGFRTVNVVGEILNEAKSEFINQMLHEIDDDSTQLEIEKWITSYFQIFAMKACLSMFSKLVHAVGIRELKDVYKKVAIKMDSPAADLVSFSINSYYNEISAGEIKELAHKYRKNPVVFQLLRARAKSYIYNNHINQKKLQQIASTLSFEITPHMVRKRTN